MLNDSDRNLISTIIKKYISKVKLEMEKEKKYEIKKKGDKGKIS